METGVFCFFSVELLFALVVGFLNTLEVTSNLISIFIAFQGITQNHYGVISLQKKQLLLSPYPFFVNTRTIFNTPLQCHNQFLHQAYATPTSIIKIGNDSNDDPLAGWDFDTKCFTLSLSDHSIAHYINSRQLRNDGTYPLENMSKILSNQIANRKVD